MNEENVASGPLMTEEEFQARLKDMSREEICGIPEYVEEDSICVPCGGNDHGASR